MQHPHLDSLGIVYVVNLWKSLQTYNATAYNLVAGASKRGRSHVIKETRADS